MRCHLDFLVAVEDVVEETELRALSSARACLLTEPLREYAPGVTAIVIAVRLWKGFVFDSLISGLFGVAVIGIQLLDALFVLYLCDAGGKPPT